MGATTTQPLLRVQGLGASLGPVGALAGIDLTVSSGEIVALTGDPGAGKTALIRCIAGDLPTSEGVVAVAGEQVRIEPGAAQRQGIAVIWQTAELCDNLNIASNILLGRETAGLLMSESRFHAAALAILEGLRIPIRDTTRLAGTLTSGERQLLAIASAISREPRLLLFDEPTAPLGTVEAAHVEALIEALRQRGAAIIVASRDSHQLFRIADRILVMRRGRVVAELDPAQTHPDDVAALVSGQQIDSTARRQLTRLHGLADSLVSADPSSSLSLILSALGPALGVDRACIHVRRHGRFTCPASLGFAPEQVAAIEQDLSSSDTPDPRNADPIRILDHAPVAGAWSMPVSGPSGVIAVITVLRPEAGAPERDELDLLTLYAGYASSAVEREALLDEVTARNRVLETIREMLEALTGPATVGDGLASALQSLRRGLRAQEVGLLTRLADGATTWRAYADTFGTDVTAMSDDLREIAEQAIAELPVDGTARTLAAGPGVRALAVSFTAPGGRTTLLATWPQSAFTEEETPLIEDAAHSLRLALDGEEAELAHREAMTLRRSRQLQRGFLSRLSHELRTPLTAIRGYATTLRQPDVTWDGESEQRFLDRIAAESGRLGRLVDDLLDFSAIESGVMRLQHDWCDLGLVVGAAVSCLPADWARNIETSCDEDLPVVWADHDRLEQVFVNLLSNAFRHNAPGTHVTVTVEARTAANKVEITVHDDGAGFPAGIAAAPFEAARRNRSTSAGAGAGLGLSIARGIIDAHAGQIALVDAPHGAMFRIELPIEADNAPDPSEGGEAVEVGVDA